MSIHHKLMNNKNKKIIKKSKSYKITLMSTFKVFNDIEDVKNAESTVRNCYPCGRTSVPYPLSPGRDCGDPMYFSFQCSSSMDNLTFKAPSGEYQVISIDPHN